ncbi:uncharacterized protein LOC119668849 [Teleopsis dalmanni]|uniref:uncharacterized protein LOC119668849 n=1 Tax=Teleopsis dalmanni TaxID=139649 RepID=UPI0018CDFBA4|nr:uncharacterized protein LOC119668849 [Teleopsis dalmanni]
MNILMLNDDCLEEIFKCLGAEEQIINILVCRRFKKIIEALWHRNTLSRIRCNMFKTYAIKRKKFEDYLFQIQYIITKMDIRIFNDENIKSINKFVFPNVKELSCSTIDENEQISTSQAYNKDELAKMFGMSFPNLTKLSIRSDITGKYIDSLPFLEDLNLSGCKFLEAKYLSRIFTSVKLKKLTFLYFGKKYFDFEIDNIVRCTTLEEVIIDYYHLKLLVDILPNMANLRKITCYSSEDFTLRLPYEIETKLKKIALNHCFSYSMMFYLLKNMVNLEKLYVYGASFYDYEMEWLAKDLQNLRELHIDNCVFQTKNGLLNFVKYFNLEVLSISETELSNSFIKELNDIISAKCPEKPLRVYCTKTTASVEFIKNVMDLSPMIQFSFESIEKPLPFKGYSLEWDPNDK